MIYLKRQLLVAFVIALAVAGCGGSSSSSSNGSPPAEGSASSGVSPQEPSGEAASSFLKPKNPGNKYVRFGREGTSTAREAASQVLIQSFIARQAGDFATQCRTLTRAAKAEVAGVEKPSAARAACPKALQKLAEPLSGTKEARKNTLGGPIDALRIEGKKAYALFHGTDGKNYAMPMTMEAGAWKVAGIIAVEIG